MNRDKPYLLSIIVVSSGARNKEIQDLKAQLKDQKIAIVLYDYNQNDIRKNGERLNEFLRKECLLANCVAITNVFPNPKTFDFKAILEKHFGQANQYICELSNEPWQSREEKRVWVSMRAYLWVELGGVCSILSHPNNVYADIIARARFREIPRLNFNINLDRKERVSALVDIRANLIVEDEKKLEDILPYQNYLKLKSPDFLVIGVQKSSSSSIISSLGLHPEIYTPMVKHEGIVSQEVHFFDSKRYAELGFKWYQSLFYHPVKRVSGEKTPEYISNFYAQRRIRKHLPNVKLILSLRNPVDRAWSAMQHIRRMNASWGLDAIKAGTSTQAFDLLTREYLDDFMITRGIYIDQIKHLFELFQKNQVKILVHESMHTHHAKVYRELFEFLGVDASFQTAPQHANRGSHEESRSRESLERLYEFYKPHNEKLFEFLGYEIPEWQLPK